MGGGGSGRQTSFCPNSDYIAMSEPLFGPKQLHSWAALFARPEASLAHKGLCLFMLMVQKQPSCRSWSFTSPSKLSSLMDMNCKGDGFEKDDDGYGGMIMVLPPPNCESISRSGAVPTLFSLSPTLFSETNDPTPDVKLLAWKWGKGEKGWSSLLDKSGIGPHPK